MTTFRELNLKSSYESGENDLIEEFYSPLLECATSYDRIAGFFSSTSLAIAAKGIAGLIVNKGHMRLIACPRLDPDDIRILEELNSGTEDFLSNIIINEFNEIEDVFKNDHIKALAWMLVNGYLEIKLAVVKNKNLIYTPSEIENTGIFHQKVGILKDINGDRISFSGSINETASGWLNNVEEFKTFRSWNNEVVYVDNDEKKFDDFWNNKRDNVKTYTISESLKEKIITMSKNFDVENITVKNYLRNKDQRDKQKEISLFSYQSEAVKKWINNDYQLLFEMATGTGKTRTAISCMNKLLLARNKLLTIVSCPQGTLSLQWKKNVDELELKYGRSLIIDGTNKFWRSDLEAVLLEMSLGLLDNAIIYTTHKTCSKSDFISIIESNSSNLDILFVGDEAHGLGAIKNRKGLLSLYKYRIGLSATPSRWFDDDGTYYLNKYFGNSIYQFTIHDALTTINELTGKTFLVPYNYCLKYISLNENELDEYKKITNRVKRLYSYSNGSDKYASVLENLIFKRANLIKNAVGKYDMLRTILKSMKDVSRLLVFVSPEQLDKTKLIMNEFGIPYNCITEKTGTKAQERYNGKTERQWIIDKFVDNKYRALVAMKCLDEGIDIPCAENAILMSSSTNPREYIQRIGRIIRQSDGKKEANLWDITIQPCYNKILDPELREFEKMIFDKEKSRILDILINAKNSASVLEEFYQRME